MFLIIKKCEGVDVEPFKHLSAEIKSVSEIENDVLEINKYKAIIILGGDGTILRLIHNYKGLPPLIAVNYGTFGFLTNFHKSEFIEGRANFRIENMMVNNRNRLLINFDNTSRYFLNEAVLTTKKRKLNTFTINIKNKIRDLVVKADSLIICTMTGSTAYNHSLFGPTLLNDDSVVINLVAPNKSNFRPLICNLQDEIQVACDEKRDAICIIDGKEYCFHSFVVKWDGNFVSFLANKSVDSTQLSNFHHLSKIFKE